jgi:hypothetical protein
LEELWALREPDPSTPASLQSLIDHAAAFEVPKPNEISHYTLESDIEAIAEQA